MTEPQGLPDPVLQGVPRLGHGQPFSRWRLSCLRQKELVELQRVFGLVHLPVLVMLGEDLQKLLSLAGLYGLPRVPVEMRVAVADPLEVIGYVLFLGPHGPGQIVAEGLKDNRLFD